MLMLAWCLAVLLGAQLVGLVVVIALFPKQAMMAMWFMLTSEDVR